jgi:hypothetical protein
MSRHSLFFSSRLLVLSICLCIGSAPCTTSGALAQSAGNPAAAAIAPATQPLEGGAQVVVLSLTDLREVGLDLKHLEHGASHLYDEVTLQPMTLNMMPEMIGPGVIINIPVSTQAAGPPVPAKPARVQAAMTEIGSIVSAMKSSVDQFMAGEKQLSMPGDAQQQLDQEVQQWVTGVNNVFGQYNALQQLTQTSPYNQPAIAQACSTIIQNVRDLEKVRRQMYKVIQREGKREEKLQRGR